MRSFPILVDLGLVVMAAAAFLLIGRVLRIPPILSYLLAGLLLGPGTGLLGGGDSVVLFSELGVALLLFIVGLEMQLARVRDLGTTALVVGLAQVGITAAAGAGLGGLLGFGRGEAVLLGLGLTFSSTVVVVKLLDRTGGVTAVWGRAAIGVLLVQDVVVAIVLTVLRGSGGAGVGGALALGMGRAALGMVALAAAAWIGGRWILSDLLGRVAASAEALLVVSLTWAFALILAAEQLGVSIELGAFLAGVAVAQLPYADELARRVHPLADLFLAVFFVSLAAGLELDAAQAVWPEALALSAFVLVFKPAVVTLLLVARGQPPRTALLSAITLGQVSEFGFVLMATAAAAGLLTGPELPALMTVVGLITIGASSALLPMLSRTLSDGTAEPGAAELSGHIVVVGMNTLGRMVVERFAARGERVVAVDANPDQLLGLPAETVFGSADHPAVLRHAGVARAKLVVVATRLEDTNALLAYRCNRMGVPVSVHAFDPALEEELLDIGADHVMISKLDGTRLVDRELRRLGVIG
jgi:Kef-type K+ transport system membrane component KefB